MEEQQESRRYRPGEAAKRLGITTHTLAQWRRDGKIQGTEEKNITWYSEEQILRARTEPYKPGPKNRQKRDNEDLKHRWRICDTGGSSTQESRQAVGA